MSITVERAQKTVAFCTNLALKAAHEEAVTALDAARAAVGGDVREVPPQAVTEAARAVQALEEQMRARTLTFTIEGWPRKRWMEFEETHRPRSGNENDRVYNIDLSSLDEALAAVGKPFEPHKWPRAIVSVTAPDGTPVDFDPHTEWVPLADEMTNVQWEDFALAFLAVNRGIKAAPFSEAASRVIRKSETSSN
jgi:hypothetical protein